jgi:hypothetical protein
MADKFRSTVKVVELEVNDNGDIIKLPLSDENFIKKFYDFVTNIQAKSKELDAKKVKDLPDTEIIQKDIEFHEYLKEEFIKLFGDGSYEKVFGENVLVSVEYVLEFIEACTPYIEKHTEERLEKFSKYSANRTGSSL